MHGVAKVPAKRAPRIGEHNDEVLKGLGFTTDDIDAPSGQRDNPSATTRISRGGLRQIEEQMTQPRIVIVGGGFGGLAAAKALKNTPAQVILIDRTNHHLFQPLLYQVATAALTPSQIATPIRSIFRKQKNVTVILGEVSGVDKERKCVFVSDADRERVPVAYDYLILATGATHSYFGHNEFEEYAPGLKSLADAVSSRNKILAGIRAGGG